MFKAKIQRIRINSTICCKKYSYEHKSLDESTKSTKNVVDQYS